MGMRLFIIAVSDCGRFCFRESFLMGHCKSCVWKWINRRVKIIFHRDRWRSHFLGQLSRKQEKIIRTSPNLKYRFDR